jgi:CubicO group peptidase (beta-lactamase class C family)
VKRSYLLLLIVGCIAGLLAVAVFRHGDFVGENLLDPGRMERWDDIVAAYKSIYNYINIALVRDGELVLTKTYCRNRLEKTDVYASVSKPVTAMIFMHLLESGKIENVQDVILRYCPDNTDVMPERYADSPITFYHLLTHQSGVPHLSSMWDGEKLDLAFRPGTDVMYSSNAFGILGFAMAQVTGMSYPELIETYIAKPVGAESFEAPDSFAAPSGQVRSTIYDMALFAIGVMDGTYVADELILDLMFQRHASSENGEICLGWYCDGVDSTNMTIFHNGSNGRPRAHLRIKPEKGMAVAITGMNRSESGVQNFAELSIELTEFLEDSHR